MDPAAAHVATVWAALGWVAATMIAGLASRRADWSRVRRPETAHPYLGSLLALVVLWSIGASIGGTSLHFLGMGALCLSAGPSLALVGGAVVVAIATLLRDAPLVNVGLVYVALVAVPVAVQLSLLALVRRFLPRNPFAWFFGVAFLGGTLSFFAGALAGAALAHTVTMPWGEFALFVLMLAVGEGTLTGMLLTLAIVYRPAWVATFDDARDMEMR